MTMITITGASGIEGKVVRRGHEGYENLRQATCWHDRVPERYPEVIVIATSDHDVIGAVKLAREEGLKVAVRSGGHSWSGSHLRDDSVLIDMSNLRRVEVDEETMTATVQPGITGVELAAMLASRDLFFPTGHSTGVGIGGYLLQGGFGWAGRDYGPACLSVSAIDVVTANGDVVHADDAENSDLLWAARGAGPGFFGVVTRFYLKVYPRRSVTMTSTYMFPVDLAPQVLGFVHEVGRDTPVELLTLITRAPMPGEPLMVVLVAVAYTDTEEEARTQLSLFQTMPIRDLAVMAQLNELTDHVTLTRTADGGRFEDSERWLADNVATRADFADLWPTIKEMVDSWPEGWPTHLMVFNWDHDKQPERPPMAFSVDGNFFYGLYVQWSDSADDEKNIRWATEHMRALEPFATGTALSDENLINRPFPFVSEESLRRLDDLRSTWDPNDVFVSWLGRPKR
jgi:FAD/FMN-containing dehydrogenase